MALSAGTRLGSYEIVGALGAGGMGEVYRARDTTLGRDVALKILPESFSGDPDRLARFQREAQVLASLNHPNIAAIYGLEHSDGVRALVLELVEGSTLADRIIQGPVPLDEAVPIAQQIADAVGAAHEQGIIHRDLKPANIKLRPDGTVKVLDFGLAKALEPASAIRADVTTSPTITSPAMMTGMGVILGTAAYMAPEQAKGRPAHRRSDVWAFGCVLYEMLTGKRAFQGEDVSDTLATVLKGEPDWSALPPTTPPAIRTLLQRSLAKDSRRRLSDLADARLELDDAQLYETSAVAGRNAVSTDIRSSVRYAPSWAVAAGLGLVVGVAGVLMLWAPWRKASPLAPIRLSAVLGADAALVTDQGAAAVLSPDGSLLAFVAQKMGTSPQLFVRRLDQLRAMPLAGTDDARNPFFSPDGQSIGFFAGGKLKKIAVTGGAAVTLCDAPTGRGGTWLEDGTIVFLPTTFQGASLLRVSSGGGKPEPLTTLGEGEVTQRWPQALPGGKALLYTASSNTAAYEAANLVVQPLPSGARKVVQRGAYYGRYLPSGHLVYLQGGTLFAATFDLDKLELSGQPVPVVDGVSGNRVGGAQFAVSDNGTLVYVPGQSVGDDAVAISWMDRAGKTSARRAMPANWSNPRFAPNGSRLAVDIFDGTQTDVWIYDWSRDVLSRLTFDAADDGKPVWTPDGNRIVFRSNRADKSTFNLYWQRADGTGDVQRLTDSGNSQAPFSWHPSSKFLAFQEGSPKTGNDLMILPIAGDEASGWKPGEPTVFLSSPLPELCPMFSPDGRWLAYFSGEVGRNEVYVRPFPGPGGQWLISNGGGIEPTWSLTRHELFYGSGQIRSDGQIMVVPYTVEGNSFRAEKPRPWSETRYLARPRLDSFDLHPDGERFAVALVPDSQRGTEQNELVFIFNFFDELRRVARATK